MNNQFEFYNYNYEEGFQVLVSKHYICPYKLGINPHNLNLMRNFLGGVNLTKVFKAIVISLHESQNHKDGFLESKIDDINSQTSNSFLVHLIK